MRARSIAPLVALAVACVCVGNAPMASATSGTDLIGTVGLNAGSYSRISFSDGTTATFSVDTPRLELGNNASCMKNLGTGNSCNWGSTHAPVDYSGIYSLDAVKEAQGVGIWMNPSAWFNLCRFNEVQYNSQPSATVDDPVACNSGNSFGTFSITFSRPITETTLHVNNLGGGVGYGYAPNGQHNNWDEWVTFWPTYTLTTSGVTLTEESHRGNLTVTGSSIATLERVGKNFNMVTEPGAAWGYPLPYAGYQEPGTALQIQNPGGDYTVGAGSVKFSSATPFTTLQFQVRYSTMVTTNQQHFSDTFIRTDNQNSAWDATAFGLTIPNPTSTPGSSPSTDPALPAIIAQDSAYTTPYETPITVPALDGALANDSGYAIQVAQTDQPANGSVAMMGDGSFTYTPNKGFSGKDCWSYVIADPYGQSARANICVTVPRPAVAEVVPAVLPASSASEPAATPRRTVIPAKSTKPVMFSPMKTASPAENSRLQVKASEIASARGSRWTNRVVVPGKGTWRLVAGQVQFTPVAGFKGELTIRYRVRDLNGMYADSTYTVVTSEVPSSIGSGS